MVHLQVYRWDAMNKKHVVSGLTTMPRLCIWFGDGEEQKVKIKGFVTVEATSAGGPVFMRADVNWPVYQ